MSMQRLSEKTCRRIAAHTGLDVVTGWAQGYKFKNLTHQVKTADDQVHLVDIRTWQHRPLSDVRAEESAEIAATHARHALIRQAMGFDASGNLEVTLPSP